MIVHRRIQSRNIVGALFPLGDRQRIPLPTHLQSTSCPSPIFASSNFLGTGGQRRILRGEMTDSQNGSALVFLYGTLKRSFPNYKHLQNNRGAVFVGNVQTVHSMPLVIGPYGIPFLINTPDCDGAYAVQGELFAVSRSTLAFLDDFEGVSHRFYQRIKVAVRRHSPDGIVSAWTYVRFPESSADDVARTHSTWREWTAVKLAQLPCISQYTLEHAKSYLSRELRENADGVITHHPPD